LSAIVDRLLAKDRDQRPSSGADVQCALNASGDSNREDLIASVVKQVLGDAGDVTIIQRLPTSSTTTPLTAGQPSSPLVIPAGTGTRRRGLRPGSRGTTGSITGSDITQLGAASQASALAGPTVAGQQMPAGTGPITATATPIPGHTGNVTAEVAMPPMA